MCVSVEIVRVLSFICIYLGSLCLNVEEIGQSGEKNASRVALRLGGMAVTRRCSGA